MKLTNYLDISSDAVQKIMVLVSMETHFPGIKG